MVPIKCLGRRKMTLVFLSNISILTSLLVCWLIKNQDIILYSASPRKLLKSSQRRKNFNFIIPQCDFMHFDVWFIILVLLMQLKNLYFESETPQFPSFSKIEIGDGKCIKLCNIFWNN